MRGAIYLRVSTDEQTTDNQERELRATAERAGHEVVAVYLDAGISGAKGRDKRPGSMFGIGSRAQKAEQALRQAMAQHEKLVQELNTALSERDEYLRQRDIALGERNVFLRQRDVALGEANEFRRQRDQLLSENEQLKLGKVERTRSEPPPSG